MTALQSDAPKTIDSSPKKLGRPVNPLTVAKCLQSKECTVCGKMFIRGRKLPNGTMEALGDVKWAKRQFCSNKCSAKGQVRTKRPAYTHHKNGTIRAPWRTEAATITKTCENCGDTFRPRMYDLGNRIKAMSRDVWARTRFCSISCAKKQENAMHDPVAVEKMTQTLLDIGHRPKIRGGNGRGSTKAQAALIATLGPEWKAEFVQATQIRKGNGYPTCYKIDIAHPKLKIAIEVDGGSHVGKRKMLDAKKDAFLRSKGWRVYRVSNSRALAMSAICRSQDILLILQTDS